jgi:hypothetical protein
MELLLATHLCPSLDGAGDGKVNRSGKVEKDCMKAKLFIPSVRVPRPTRTRPARFLLPLLLITLALMLAGSQVDAHGSGFYQIRGAQIDPYFVHVWVAPGVLRTGNVHVDTVILDTEGNPALDTLVRVTIVPLESEATPLVSLVGEPNWEYPYSRGASFRIDTPGMYRLEVMVSDSSGAGGMTSADVEVTTIGWHVKAMILALGLFSAATGVWLLAMTRAFWVGRSLNRKVMLKHIHIRSLAKKSYIRGGVSFMNKGQLANFQDRMAILYQRLNGPLHAPALWIFMMIIVAHWMEHVLQIYQIYGLGWEPAVAGGVLGVIFPKLVESEILHFVYDFIQWAGIVVLRPGFKGRARTFWTVAMIAQTWHYIEHVLLMGQYLSGYYLFGAAKQTSILQYWFPRAELHFVYNLLVFIPMVIAVHYYVQPKLMELAALNAASLEEATAESSEQA